MTNRRLHLPILIAVALAGVAHAGEFSFGGARQLAQSNTQQGAVDVTLNFTDRGRALRESAEGGDTATTTHDARTLRGTDPVAATEAPAAHKATPTPAPSPKSSDTASTDSPHGVSISPSTAIRRPSYRWQSLVPGTIK
jgi:hypothetical protein